MKQSFQAGVDTIYNMLVSCGETPTDKTPTSIANKIQQFHADRYSTGYSIGYKEGRTQGQHDVMGNPNSYNLYTKTQYDSHYNEGYNAGLKAGQSATKSVTVRTFISSHTWQCYAITYINDKEVCRVDSTNPSDDSTITKSNTTQVTI